MLYRLCESISEIIAVSISQLPVTVRGRNIRPSSMINRENGSPYSAPEKVAHINPHSKTIHYTLFMNTSIVSRAMLIYVCAKNPATREQMRSDLMQLAADCQDRGLSTTYSSVISA